jgi:hypothetical protein
MSRAMSVWSVEISAAAQRVDKGSGIPVPKYYCGELCARCDPGNGEELGTEVFSSRPSFAGGRSPVSGW